MAIAVEEFSNLEIYGIGITLFLMAIVGVISNGVVMFLYIKEKSLKTPMNSLFISLIVGDLTVCLFGTLVSAIYTLTKTVMGPTVCQLYGFITFFGGTADAIALTYIAVERYLTVARPFNLGSINARRAKIGIGMVYLLSLLTAGAPLVGLSSYINEGAGFWCSISWEKSDLSTVVYIILAFFASYFFPIIIIIFCYSIVVSKVKQVAKAGASEQTLKAEKQITNQSIAMVVGFMVAWTPYAIVCLAVVITEENILGPKVAMLPSMMAKSSFLYNPFIYVALNKQFRSAFIKVFFKGKDPFAKKEVVQAIAQSEDVKTLGITKTGAQENLGADLKDEQNGAALRTNQVGPAP